MLAVSVWADSLSNKCSSFHSDNRAVVGITNSQTSKYTKVMHLMRKLVLSCLRHNILFRAAHIPVINNNLADSLSRGKVPGIGAKGLSLSCQHSLSPSIAVLTRHAEELLASALAPGTQAAYKRSWSMFGKFCNTHGLPDKVPISVSVLALFISHLHRARYSPATVSSHISAMGYIHKLRGGSDPTTTFLVQKLLSACHKLSLRMPIDKPMLSRLLGALDFTVPGKHHRALYKAMFCLAFHAFLRIGEMTLQ